MEDENKVVLPDTTKEIVIDFDAACRFCLSEARSGISISDKCLCEESERLGQESIYDFMRKLRFIKMDDLETFPSQVCKDCFQLIQLCYNFRQVCEKSENLLRDYHRNKTKEIFKTELDIPVKDVCNQECGNHPQFCTVQNVTKPLNDSPVVMDEVNTTKMSNTEWKLRESACVLDAYKRKLYSLPWTAKTTVNASDENIKPECKQFVQSCSECLLKFNSLQALNSHCATKHRKRFRKLFKFQCKHCVKSFHDLYNLRRHYKVIHKVEVPDECLNNSVKNIIEDGNKKFYCTHCVPYKGFQSREELMLHLVDSHQNEGSKDVPELYACAYCSDLTFPTRVGVNEHLFLVHKIKEEEITLNDVKCVSLAEDSQVLVSTNPSYSSQRDTQLTDVSSLLEVLNSVVDSLSVAQQGKGFKIVCKNCSPPNPEFTSANDFAQHIRSRHDESRLLENWANKNVGWSCSECPARYTRKQTLCYHMREKHKRSLSGMKCPEADCQESFVSNRRLIQHGITVHQKYFAYFHEVFKKILQNEEEGGNRVKNFECDVCQKRYIYKSSLRKHILETHLGKSLKNSAVCPYCGKTISSKLNLKSHIEFVHEALFVSCPICKKKINFRTIGKHYKTHRTTSDGVSSANSFLCNLCGRILKSKRSFEDHQKLHKNIRDELCDICGSGFTTKKFLKLHKKTHEGVQRKSFACDQCEKVFSGRHTLNRHLLTHSGEKNFICEICSKCFYTLQELNRHVRYHKKEYRYDCQLCEMRFLDKSRFRHHMMRHRNVRPHKCQFCDKMFIVRGKMNLHMATKHNFEVRDTKGVWKDPKTYVPLDDLL